MKTDGFFGGPITQALIPGRSLRVPGRGIKQLTKAFKIRFGLQASNRYILVLTVGRLAKLLRS
jgi:hypothetical protein